MSGMGAPFPSASSSSRWSGSDFGVVTAKSTWLSSEGTYRNLFEQNFTISATIGNPTSVVLSDSPGLSLSEWFGEDNGHLVVLMFAWAYALSARWTEILPRASPIEYTANQAPWTARAVSSEGMVVELGEVAGEAARWWAAVLAPGEGWKAAILHNRWRFLSPWSVAKEFSKTNIFLAGPSSHISSASSTPASFKTALKYIEDYSILHNADRERVVRP